MKILARCRHCHKQRMWVKGDDGVIRPSLTADDQGVVAHHPHVCSVNVAGCQPREGLGESNAQRMTRELAGVIEANGRGARLSRGKMTADMARGLALFDRKREIARQKARDKRRQKTKT